MISTSEETKEEREIEDIIADLLRLIIAKGSHSLGSIYSRKEVTY